MKLQAPPSEPFHGRLLCLHGKSILLGGSSLDSLPGEVLAQGEIQVFYGFAFLYEPGDSLLVQFALDDFRREYHGVAALEFALKKGDAFPRADMIGRRASNGKYHEAFMKELDIARGLLAFATGCPDSRQPLLHLDLAFWPVPGLTRVARLDADEQVSTLLIQSIPCYQGPLTALESLVP